METDNARKSTDYAKGAIYFWASVILWAGYHVIQLYGYACMRRKLQKNKEYGSKS